MQMPTAKFAEFLKHRKEFIKIDDTEAYKRARVQLHWKGIVVRDEIEGAVIKTKEQQVAHMGELLVAEIDAKVGGIGIVPPDVDGAVVSSHYFLFDIDEAKCSPVWLDWFIRSGGLEDQITARGSTNYAAIRPQHVLEFELPLPPLTEQRRIVSRVEELAVKIEEVKELRKCASEEVAAMETSFTELCFERLSRNGVPSYAFEEVSDRITVGHVSSMRYAYRETGVPFLRSQNVRKNRFDPKGLCFIAREFHEANPKSSLKPGDVVIVRTGFVGVACVIPTNLKEANCADLVIVRPGPKLDSEYAARFLNSASGKNRATSASVGSAQKHYNVGAMRRTKIPLPPLEEQRRIVAHLDNLQSSVDATKKLQSETAAELDALMPSILSKAFRGEL
jgi:type I restriction enzyme, S subunit